MVKFKVKYDTETSLPVLIFEYNTNSTELEESVFKAFLDKTQTMTISPNTENKQDGTTEVKLNLIE